MKATVIIRADGSTATGMGHVVRSLALAEMLANDFSISFAIQQPDTAVLEKINAVTSAVIALPQTDDYAADAQQFTRSVSTGDIVVLDGYHFKTAYQEAIKAKGAKLVCIDDLHAWHQVADAIINHAEGITPAAYSAEDYTQFYLGLNYALLRKPFLEPAASPKRIERISSVFISMGAADVHNLTLRFMEALAQVKGIDAIHVMLGAVNPHIPAITAFAEQQKGLNIILHIDIDAETLAELLRSCDVCICPASSISLEACAVRTALISGYTAENQLGNLRGMEKRKTLINWGDLTLLTTKGIHERFSAVAASPECLNELVSNQKAMIDNLSPKRLLKIFKELSHDEHY